MNMNHDKIAQTKPMSQSTKKVHINNKLDCLKNNVLLHFKNRFDFVIFKILLYLIKKEKSLWCVHNEGGLRHGGGPCACHDTRLPLK